MADVIRLPDGGTYIICDDRDVMELVRERLGTDLSQWLEDRLAKDEDDDAYIADLEKKADRLKEQHNEIMAELRRHSETIAALIREKEINRAKLSAEASAIGYITRRR